MAEGEVTISELELADEVLGDMVVAVDTTTDTKSVSLRQLKAWLGSSLPTGFIIPAVGRISDERFTLLDGKTLARDGTYQAFCNKVVEQVQAGNWFACTASEYEDDLTNYGQCGKFVITNDYVRIPKITRYIGATITLSEIGISYIESYSKIESAGSSGVTYTDKNIINAKFPYYMVVSTEGQTSPVEIDINEVYEDLNLKADTDYVDARMPTGTILNYGGSTAPSGFLICDGGTISRTTYASLFAVIGTTYGAGDGSTTFNLPNSSNIVYSVNTSVPIKGDGKTLGFTDGTNSGGMFVGGTGFIKVGPNNEGKSVGTTRIDGNLANNKTIGITTDETKSGIVGTITRSVLTCKHIIKY